MFSEKQFCSKNGQKPSFWFHKLYLIFISFSRFGSTRTQSSTDYQPRSQTWPQVKNVNYWMMSSEQTVSLGINLIHVWNGWTSHTWGRTELKTLKLENRKYRHPQQNSKIVQDVFLAIQQEKFGVRVHAAQNCQGKTAWKTQPEFNLHEKRFQFLVQGNVSKMSNYCQTKMKALNSNLISEKQVKRAHTVSSLKNWVL